MKARPKPEKHIMGEGKYLYALDAWADEAEKQIEAVKKLYKGKRGEAYIQLREIEEALTSTVGLF